MKYSSSWIIFEKFIYSNKKVYGYKRVTAGKQSELERCSRQYRRNHTKQCKLFMSKKSISSKSK